MVLLCASSARAAEVDAAGVRRAVERSVPLLQKSMAISIEKRQCFMCHHQALPALGVVTARERGYAIDAKALAAQIEHTAAFLKRNVDRYQKGQGTGGQVTTAGYLLLTFELGGVEPNHHTAAVAEYLLKKDKERDFYRASANRPPSEISPFTNNYLAVRGLKKYGTDKQKERIDARLARIKKWFEKAAAKDTEDRVFKLWGLHALGSDPKLIAQARAELIKTQRPDGGWAQKDDMKPDAYATGSALVVLQQAGALPTTDAVYRRGVKFLIDTQKEDGSWFLKSRSKPFQTYFESGFPFKNDQFISITATGWAVAALALAERGAN